MQENKIQDEQNGRINVQKKKQNAERKNRKSDRYEENKKGRTRK